jgi:A/G-specific adenine glycosylase
MGQLRAARAPVALRTLQQGWPDRAQLDRCLRALVADGLVEAPMAASQPVYQLPISPAR